MDYADITGVRYQYPVRSYKNVIQPGERFIYYRGRRTSQGSRAPQVYFGTGVVGAISREPGGSSRLFCEVLDYQPFEEPVPFKTDAGEYLESGGIRKGYYQKGVRRISEDDFQGILDLASILAERSSMTPATGKKKGQSYASPETATKVDEYAIRAAREYLKRSWPGSKVATMAKNNPGFDILVVGSDSSLYVEVKGTQRSLPHFFMSDGERLFSQENADRYLLIVVYAIDLEEKEHKLFSRRGGVSDAGFDLNCIS